MGAGIETHFVARAISQIILISTGKASRQKSWGSCPGAVVNRFPEGPVGAGATTELFAKDGNLTIFT